MGFVIENEKMIKTYASLMESLYEIMKQRKHAT